MRRVFISSPYRPIEGYSVQANIDLVKALCKAALDAGYAPFAPHLFYPPMLDDGIEAEREKGITAGISWLGMADELWIWDVDGISTGMEKEINRAMKFSIPPKLVHMPAAWSGVADRLGRGKKLVAQSNAIEKKEAVGQ